VAILSSIFSVEKFSLFHLKRVFARRSYSFERKSRLKLFIPEGRSSRIILSSGLASC